MLLTNTLWEALAGRNTFADPHPILTTPVPGRPAPPWPYCCIATSSCRYSALPVMARAAAGGGPPAARRARNGSAAGTAGERAEGDGGARAVGLQ